MLTTDNMVQVNDGGNIVNNEKTVKLLGIIVDSKISFEPHLSKLCKKVSQKTPCPSKNFNSHFTKEN